MFNYNIRGLTGQQGATSGSQIMSRIPANVLGGNTKLPVSKIVRTQSLRERPTSHEAPQHKVPQEQENRTTTSTDAVPHPTSYYPNLPKRTKAVGRSATFIDKRKDCTATSIRTIPEQPSLEETIEISQNSTPAIPNDPIPPSWHTSGYTMWLQARLERRAEDFPSSSIFKGKPNQPSYVWSKLIKRTIDRSKSASDCTISLDLLSSKMKNLSTIIEEIRMVFQYGILSEVGNGGSLLATHLKGFPETTMESKNAIRPEMVEYAPDILSNMLSRQEKLNKFWTLSLESKQAAIRRKLVSWIMNAARALKYVADTVHLAVGIMDAYLSTKASHLQPQAWSVLAVTVLHLAGKLEESRSAPLATLITLAEEAKLSQKGSELSKKDIFYMETAVMSTLSLELNIPIAPFFSNLVLFAGSLDFPTFDLRLVVMDITNGILYNSLLDSRFSRLTPSEKALAALEISVEFVFFYLKFYSGIDMSLYELCNPQPGKNIGSFGTELCFETFQERFSTKKMPTVVTKGISLGNPSSPMRDIKV